MNRRVLPSVVLVAVLCTSSATFSRGPDEPDEDEIVPVASKNETATFELESPLQGHTVSLTYNPHGKNWFVSNGFELHSVLLAVDRETPAKLPTDEAGRLELLNLLGRKIELHVELHHYHTQGDSDAASVIKSRLFDSIEKSAPIRQYNIKPGWHFDLLLDGEVEPISSFTAHLPDHDSIQPLEFSLSDEALQKLNGRRLALLKVRVRATYYAGFQQYELKVTVKSTLRAIHKLARFIETNTKQAPTFIVPIGGIAFSDVASHRGLRKGIEVRVISRPGEDVDSAVVGQIITEFLSVAKEDLQKASDLENQYVTLLMENGMSISGLMGSITKATEKLKSFSEERIETYHEKLKTNRFHHDGDVGFGILSIDGSWDWSDKEWRKDFTKDFRSNFSEAK